MNSRVWLANSENSQITVPKKRFRVYYQITAEQFYKWFWKFLFDFWVHNCCIFWVFIIWCFRLWWSSSRLSLFFRLHSSQWVLFIWDNRLALVLNSAVYPFQDHFTFGWEVFVYDPSKYDKLCVWSF